MSLRDQILTAEDLETRDVEVPEWPDSDGNPTVVQIRTLTGKERDAFESSFAKTGKGGRKVKSDYTNFRAKLLVRCLQDPATGEPIFTDKDAPRLGQKSSAAIDRLFEVASEMSGITDRSVEEEAEDFDETQDAPSTSG